MGAGAAKAKGAFLTFHKHYQLRDRFGDIRTYSPEADNGYKWN